MGHAAEEEPAGPGPGDLREPAPGGARTDDELVGGGPLSEETVAAVTSTLQGLATPSRLRLLDVLRRGGPETVTALAAAVAMEPSAVSHQLRVLRHLGLVTRRREGRRAIYALHDQHVAALLHEAVYHAEHLRLGFPDAL